MKKEVKKIFVEVYQNKKLVNTWNEHDNNVKQLTCFLWRKTILKSSNLRIKYSYNYSDTQTISFIEKYENYDGSITTTEYKFYNVPTNLGYLDLYNI